MKLNLTAVILFMLVACGGEKKEKDPGKDDDPIGGEEKIIDSFRCEANLPSEGKDGKPDERRGFKVEVTTFVYDGGSAASTLVTEYTFAQGVAPYVETASRVFSKNDKIMQLETDLLAVKIRKNERMGVIYKKYDPGVSELLDCK